MRLSLAPPWWGVVVFVLVATALCGLGVWQIQRGQAKQVMLAQRRAASKKPPRPLSVVFEDDRGAASGYGQRYSVQGQVDGRHQVLLDNQVFDQRVGYRVWTPVIMRDGTRVMVDRGWVGQGPNGRATPPQPEAPGADIRLTGLWRRLPEPGLRLGDGQACNQTGWPRVLAYPKISQLRCQYPGPVADGLLLLDEDDPRGFPRDWDTALTRVPPVRHYGYALQWFAMAIAVAVIFLAVNLRRRP